jgi:hypothetical protein
MESLGKVNEGPRNWFLGPASRMTPGLGGKPSANLASDAAELR